MDLAAYHVMNNFMYFFPFCSWRRTQVFSNFFGTKSATFGKVPLVFVLCVTPIVLEMIAVTMQLDFRGGVGRGLVFNVHEMAAVGKLNKKT